MTESKKIKVSIHKRKLGSDSNNADNNKLKLKKNNTKKESEETSGEDSSSDSSSSNESMEEQESSDNGESEGEESSDLDLENMEKTNVVKKQKKMSKNDDGAEQFSSAMSAILGSHLKQYERIDPVMARQKKLLEKNEQDKLDEKARKLLAREKKKFLLKSRKIDLVSSENQEGEVTKMLEQEKKLRKIAQKGVVRLFNVITATQLKTEREVNEKLQSTHIKSAIHKENEQSKLISEVSKETFLDLVKAAGNEDEDDDDLF